MNDQNQKQSAAQYAGYSQFYASAPANARGPPPARPTTSSTQQHYQFQYQFQAPSTAAHHYAQVPRPVPYNSMQTVRPPPPVFAGAHAVNHTTAAAYHNATSTTTKLNHDLAKNQNSKWDQLPHQQQQQQTPHQSISYLSHPSSSSSTNQKEYAPWQWHTGRESTMTPSPSVAEPVKFQFHAKGKPPHPAQYQVVASAPPKLYHHHPMHPPSQPQPPRLASSTFSVHQNSNHVGVPPIPRPPPPSTATSSSPSLTGPSSSASSSATAAPNKQWPPSLKAYVERAFAQSRNDADKTIIQKILKEKIASSLTANQLWTKDWDCEPLPLQTSSSSSSNMMMMMTPPPPPRPYQHHHPNNTNNLSNHNFHSNFRGASIPPRPTIHTLYSSKDSHHHHPQHSPSFLPLDDNDRDGHAAFHKGTKKSKLHPPPPHHHDHRSSSSISMDTATGKKSTKWSPKKQRKSRYITRTCMKYRYMMGM
jgi:hypothetical protein